MRSSLVHVLACMLLLPIAGNAQRVRPREAFPRSVTPWVGLRSFDTRLVAAPGTAVLMGSHSYSGSAEIGVRGDLPLSRRLGLLAELSLAPFSKQHTDFGQDGQTQISDPVLIAGGDLGIGARLKPGAPVFFYAGGGVNAASRYAAPGVEGAAIEPQGTLAVGYDGAATGRLNLRLVYARHFVFPADPGIESVRARTMASDWAFQAGGRYWLQTDRPARAATP